MFASPEPEPHSWGDISRYSRTHFRTHVMAKVGDLLAECPVRTKDANGSMWSLGWVGGPVVGSIGRRHTAYVHRDMLTLLRADDGLEERRAQAYGGRPAIAWTDEMIAPDQAPHAERELPELPQPQHQGLAAAVLRRELRPAGTGQGAV